MRRHYIDLPNSQIKELIEENIHSKRDREILYLKLIDGQTYEWIAEKFNMTPRQIQHIVYNNIKALKYS